MLNIVEELKIRKNKIYYTLKIKEILHRYFSRVGLFSSPCILIDRELIASGQFDLIYFIRKYADQDISSINCHIKNSNLFELSLDFEIPDLTFKYFLLTITINKYTLSYNYAPVLDIDVDLLPYHNSRVNSDDIIIDKNTIERYDLL